MKTTFLTALACCVAASLFAQVPGPGSVPAKRSAEELTELLGPIALYPDALISLILPAATVPEDIVLAARFIAIENDMAELDAKRWDFSVKALTRYPETLKWLDENLEWTAQIGDAFVEQPVEVMETIQQLRAKARAMGNLVDTPEQRIVQDETYLRIVPAQPDQIYEPRYDPDVVYVQRPTAAPLLFFSAAHRIGDWLSYDLDWRHRRIYRGEFRGGWDYSREKERVDRDDDRRINRNLANSRVWTPDPARPRPQSRPPAQRSPNDNAADRAPSRPAKSGAGKSPSGKIVRPSPPGGSSRPGETIRRAEQMNGGRPDGNPPARPGDKPLPNRGDSPADRSKSGITRPNSPAPKMDGDAKRKTDGDGKRGDDSKNSPPMKKDARKDDEKSGKPKPSTNDPRREEPKTRPAEAPQRPDNANRDDMKRNEPAKKDSPKSPDKPKRDDGPKKEMSKPQDKPKQNDNGPKKEKEKSQENPKRGEPKRENPKPKSDAPKQKDGGGDKKDDKKKGGGSDKKDDDGDKKKKDK